MNKPIYHFFIFLAGSFVCLYLAFSPAVNITYANHDSIRYFHKFYNHDSDSQTNPLYGFLKKDGRFVSAELEELIYKNVDHLSDMSRLRLFTIAIVALSAALLTLIVQSAGMEAVPAFCLSTVIFTLPGVQDIIFAPYLFVALGIFFSLLAYFILTKKLIYGLHFIFALVLLAASFLAYPPVTFFFLIPVTIMTIFCNDWQVFKKIWVRDISLWFLAAGTFYFISKVFLYTQIKSSGHEIAFTGKQILLNILSFPTQALPQIFNLWNVYYSIGLGISMIIFVTACIAIDCFATQKIGWRRLPALVGLFFIFNLVWFLFGGYLPRQYMTSQALVLILVYWCGDWLGNIGKRERGNWAMFWPVLLLSFGLIVTNQMTSSNALNNYSELMFIRSRLAQFVSSSTKEIHFIRLKDSSRGYNGLPTVYDNINSTTADYELPDLVRGALRDLPDPFELHCIISYSNYGEPFSLAPNSVVIDMNDLVYISTSATPEVAEVGKK